ncbi:hypothetical protein [Saccharothrix sp. HUAS TT1]|uniref:hypothetical protein n=1 Tax=unclassified Saccharothrix TaxID=2593673 RepID=UPI00345BFDDE
MVFTVCVTGSGEDMGLLGVVEGDVPEMTFGDPGEYVEVVRDVASEDAALEVVFGRPFTG